MKVIGIPLRYNKTSDDRAIVYMSERIRRTFQLAGSLVLPIAPVQDVDYINTSSKDFEELKDNEKALIEKSLDLIDGIVFPGGNKFTPYDRYLLERCIERRIPVLGICLGMQLISCYKKDVNLIKIENGTNHYFDDDNLLHHSVNIDKSSLLYKIFGKEKIDVNSFHNYSITENDKFNIAAKSDDGIIEAIEYKGDCFCVGIQWHPEISYLFDDNSKKLIDYFISIC